MGGWASFYTSVFVRNGSGNAGSPKYFGYVHLLPRDNAEVFTDNLSKLFHIFVFPHLFFT
jgi:hypothetical protein